ncbi:unnamed protein product [Nesidiocoris tenuis]|uniref:Uncharacterized protein n=1 Tax=Nesidiocoris tenuis TaxID=355587 RepID=A0A6H5H9R5_9HEMI|nr:unnamed protein product [Nesidiocoris tenuis]
MASCTAISSHLIFYSIRMATSSFAISAFQVVWSTLKPNLGTPVVRLIWQMSKNVGNHQWNCQDTTRQENSVNKKKEAKTKNESDGFKSIWSSFIRSPLFHRRKKSLDSAPPPTLKIATATAAPVQLQRWNFPSPPPTPPPPPLVSPISAQVAGNTSPLVVQRFLHQQMQHMNGGSRLNR